MGKYIPSWDIRNIAHAQKPPDLFDTKLVENAYDRAMTGVSLARIDYKISELDSSYVKKEKSLGRIEDLDVTMAATQLANTEIKLQSSAKLFFPLQLTLHQAKLCWGITLND